jgi:hypothetical protein
LNVIWLLMVILIPFATKLLTGDGNDDLTVHDFHFGFYALLQVLLSAALFAMVRHLISHHLQEPGTEEKDRSASDWRSYGPLLGFGLSIPVFFVTTYAWVLWIAMPLLVLPLRRLQHRDQSAPEAPLSRLVLHSLHAPTPGAASLRYPAGALLNSEVAQHLTQFVGEEDDALVFTSPAGGADATQQLLPSRVARLRGLRARPPTAS